MVLRVDPAWAALVLLVALRVAPLFVMAPVLGSVRAPNLVRALLVVALSAVLWPMVPNMTEVRRLHRVTEDMRALLSGLHLKAIQEGAVS